MNKDTCDNIETRLETCRQILRECRKAVVAFSGGVDSTFLLDLAIKTLGRQNVLAIVGVSPSMPQREKVEATDLASKLGAELVEMQTSEMDNPKFIANPAERCYFCKLDLFNSLIKLAKSRGFQLVLTGANADDTGDFRPGLKAGEELGIRNPLMEAGLTKNDIRELSRRAGLPTWDKPSMACLASRIPYNSPITAEKLKRIEQAENFIRDLGFRQIRVRDHETVARIEASKEDLPRLLELREKIVGQLKSMGYVYVTMDLAGFRSGSSNEILPAGAKSAVTGK